MITKRERIGPFIIYTEKDRLGKQTKTVYFEYRPVVRFNPCSSQERRVACVELVELGYCNKGVAGRICGFHRNTVARLVQTKNLLGIEGLIRDDRGPKAPWKYIGDIRKGIKELLSEHPEWTDQEIAQEASRRLGENISRSAVARIRGEGKEAKPKEEYSQEELLELAKKAEEIDVRRHDSRQLTLNFEADPEFAKKSEEFKQEEAPSARTETDQQLLKRLEEGQRNVFAGSLLHSLFLEEINFQGAFGDISSKEEAFYSQEEIVKALYYGLHSGLPSIESHKLVNSMDLGLMLGRVSSPDEATIRMKLNQMAEQNPSRKLIDYFAQAFLRQGFIDPEVFYPSFRTRDNNFSIFPLINN